MHCDMHGNGKRNSTTSTLAEVPCGNVTTMNAFLYYLPQDILIGTIVSMSFVLRLRLSSTRTNEIPN